MELEIQPLIQERLPDLAALFGQGGDPKWCWCAFFRVRQVDFSNATAESNREILEQAVETTGAEGRAPGLIAYHGGEPVGWVSVGPRDDYERLRHSRVLAAVDDMPVWSIVCFVVARSARNRGVARALLDAAIAYAGDRGATLLEAYPVDTGGERILSANVYRGTLAMFQRAGFEVVARRRANRTSPERPIVRRAVST
ncbi:MAG TPA: GNAT family N-acetyltransferase [Candidatus Limnocylindrales bacterium]|nr:GNAT family N-acetyltransferase [Candidatus Limnocylindrales bacterium]